MDLELEVSIKELADLLKDIGFDKVKIRNDILEAKKKKGWGRIHVLAKEITSGKVYADVHWDALIHFLMIGVDYERRPKEICELIIKTLAKRNKKGRIIGGTSWFSRKNKAIITGLKI